MARKHDCYKPYPEIVERQRPDGAWEIRDAADAGLPTNGAVNQVDRWLVVPLTEDGKPVARHELKHVRCSPLRFPRVRFDLRLLAGLEDARINLSLDAEGLGVALDAEGRAYVCWLAAQDAKRGDVFALLVRTVASLGTNVEAELRAQLDELGRVGRFVAGHVDRVRLALERGRKRTGGEIAPFALAHRVARQMARELKAVRVLDRQGRANTALPEGGDCCIGHVHGDAEEDDGEDAGGRRARRHEEAEDGDGPGSMAIRRVPLAVRLHRGRSAGRGWRPSTEGSVLRYPHRWVPDQAVFRRRARGRRGSLSVLIDTSGSMSLAEDGLDRLLRATPQGARVAMYSGRGTRGELRIVAWGERRAAAEHLEPYGKGNIVDVPALQWLASQPAPRVWVSDGAVTGIGDQRCRKVDEQVEALCRRGAIQRVEDVDEAAAFVRGEREGGRR
jgi:hypothetical protein